MAKRMTKQEQINRLQEDYDTMQRLAMNRGREVEEFREILSKVKRELNISGEATLSDVVRAINALKHEIDKRTGEENVYIGNLQRENEKLWYLIRCGIGDPTINTERATPFFDPRRGSETPFPQ